MMEIPQVADNKKVEDRIAKVLFIRSGRIFTVSCGSVEVNYQDNVIVELERGEELARLITPPQIVKFCNMPKLFKITRKATEKDLEQYKTNLELEKKAYDFCLERIAFRALPMKLVTVRYGYDQNKAIFFFTANGRIDFRELVKDLAHELKIRIEMRQIGVRDHARMLGGIGNCGREICCSTFLYNLEPVSIKMAKDQELTLIPSKISGLCGRLMCCLAFEHDIYSESRKILPRIGSLVRTKMGDGYVTNINLLKNTIIVEFAEGKEAELGADEFILLEGPRKKSEQANEPPQESLPPTEENTS